jgi:hypothetical protein
MELDGDVDVMGKVVRQIGRKPIEIALKTS